MKTVRLIRLVRLCAVGDDRMTMTLTGVGKSRLFGGGSWFTLKMASQQASNKVGGAITLKQIHTYSWYVSESVTMPLP